MEKIYLILGLVGLATLVFGQHEEHHEAQSDHASGYFEIITSVVNVYSFDEEESSLGNEMHFTYWFEGRWGTGLSLTTKQLEGDLIYDTALIGSWSPLRWLTTNIGSNISWGSDHRDFGVSAYLEIEINFFVIEKIHLGPVLGGLVGSEDEFGHGFHLGFEF